MSWDSLPQTRRDAAQRILTNQQLAVISRRLNGLSWRQISFDLDINTATAREHYARAIERLRKELRP